MGTADNSYNQKLQDYQAEQKKIIEQNKDKVKAATLFNLLYPRGLLDTPEKQAESYRLIEKFQNLIDTNKLSVLKIRR